MKNYSLKNIDIIIIGAGFYGCFAALTLKEKNKKLKIVIIEKESQIMQRASKNNQARIHAGYFFPKDIRTACKFLVCAPKFIIEFSEAIFENFTNIYAVSKNTSKITSDQFYNRYKKINAKIKEAPSKILNLFNKDLIEKAFVVNEKVFDAKILQEIVCEKLRKMDVEIYYEHEVEKIRKKNGALTVSFTNNNESLMATTVYNCTYAQINQILMRSDLHILPLEHEFTEMVVLKVPEIFNSIAITVVDGPFFSLMPYPSEKLHTLSHVLYTKHFEWNDSNMIERKNKEFKSNYKYMIQDAAKFLPSLLYSEFIKSMYETKTKISPFKCSKVPFIASHEIDGLYSILGGKMDKVFELGQLSNSLKYQEKAYPPYTRH